MGMSPRKIRKASKPWQSIATMPELFFIRMQQPEMSDLEVTKSIQQEHELKAIPVGIMAVLSERSGRVRELDAEISDFLNEPGETLCLLY